MGENLKAFILLAAMRINLFVVWHKAVIDSAAFCTDNMIMRIRIPIKMFHFIIGKQVRDDSILHSICKHAVYGGNPNIIASLHQNLMQLLRCRMTVQFFITE